MIRAPIATSLSVKKSRLSNIFSKISTVPNACVATVTAIDVRSAGNAGHGPSSIFGIVPPRSSSTTSCCRGGTRIVVPSISISHAERRERGQDRDRDRSARRPRSSMSPPVIAARPMKLADLDVVGADAPLAARSGSTPLMRSTFDSMPSICAPSETRKRQRSCTCGSQAALPITVSPGASTAAMIAFSVAMTLASSRKMRVAAQPVARAHLVAAARCRRRRRARRTRGCAGRAGAGRSRRRRAAARSRGRSARAAGRRAGTTRGCVLQSSAVELVLRDVGRVDAHLVRPGPLDVGAEVGEQLEHRVDVADPRHVRSVTGSSASSVAARIGSAPFLFPAALMVPERR